MQRSKFKTVPAAIRAVTGLSSPPGTWRRWVRSGLISRSGKRVTLRTIKLGGRLFCTDAYVREFIKATNAIAPDGTQLQPKGDSVSELAKRYLDQELGIAGDQND